MTSHGSIFGPVAGQGPCALESLDVSFNAMGAKGARSMADALESNATLTTMRLVHCGCGPEGAKALAAALEHNRSLRSLALGRNGVGVAGAAALAAMLRRNGTLTELALPANRLGPVGARLLAEALRAARHRTLVVLDLARNGVGTDGAAAFAAGRIPRRRATVEADAEAGKGKGKRATAAALPQAPLAGSKSSNLTPVQMSERPREKPLDVRLGDIVLTAAAPYRSATAPVSMLLAQSQYTAKQPGDDPLQDPRSSEAYRNFVGPVEVLEEHFRTVVAARSCSSTVAADELGSATEMRCALLVEHYSEEQLQHLADGAGVRHHAKTKHANGTGIDALRAMLMEHFVALLF